MAVNAATVKGYPIAAPTMFVGTYAGTTAAQTINIGFKPCLVWAWDMTSGTTMYLWTSNDTSNVGTIITTAGPASTASAITTTDQGFSLPASDNNTNKNGDTYVFLAVKA